MSENNSKYIATKTNELARNNEHNNPWVIGISNSHPGQRYFFNTITGDSRWHISIEEMERYLPHLRQNGSQYQYGNSPEPIEPPPNKRSLIKNCQHTAQYPKIVNREIANGFQKLSSGITCELCCSPLNQLSSSFHQRLDDPECTVLLNNTTPQSQVPLSATSASSISSYECIFGCSKPKHLERKICCSGENSDITVQDTKYHQHMPNRTDNVDQWFEKSTNLEMLDVSPLKILAKSGCIDDKWYIVADVSVYLHSIQLLRTILNSDHQCCLMVPQYVKVELEKATNTNLKTKAYCANYFIYKLLDDGVAVMDKDINLQLNKDKLDKENLINCCIKLTNQNYFVILITNDIQLKKYQHKINIPVFTVIQLKDYICRRSHLRAPTSPEQSLIVPYGKKIKVTAPLATNSNISDYNASVQNEHNTTVVKRDQSIQTNTTEEQIKNKRLPNRAVEAGVQTDLSLTQIEEMENVYKKTHLNDQNNRVEEKESMLSQWRGQLLSNTNQGSRKHIKLRRRKVTNQPVSADQSRLVSLSEIQNNVNSLVVSPSSVNFVQIKDLANQNSQNTLLTSMCDSKKTDVGDKSENTTNCFLEPHLHDTVQSHSYPNNSTCNVEEVWNNYNKVLKKSLEKVNLEKTDDSKQKNSPTSTYQEQSHTFENKNVMFEITNEIMEENLKIKCDEWVSRFVQIMEEVLTQVLRKTSSLYLPPPWNMYEATVCIGQKYKDDVDVSDASTKLLNVLNCISDVKGNSKINISPIKFMELYSFGVYLIDALQGILNTCEDLQIAAGSLTKLLSDIQNPESDLSNIESFQDISQEDTRIDENEYNCNEMDPVKDSDNRTNIRQTKNIQILRYNNDEFTHINAPTEVTTNNVSLNNTSKRSENLLYPAEELNKSIPTNGNQSQSKAVNIKGTLNENTITCNEKSVRSPNKGSVISPNLNSLRALRLKKTIFQITQEKENLDRELSEQSCPKSVFLSNLLLHDTKHLPENNEENIISDNLFNDVQSSQDKESSDKENSYVSNVQANINKTGDEPKIIRNFVMCSEFEDRIRNNKVQEEFDDYDFDENMEVDYNDVDDFTNNKSKSDVAEFSDHKLSTYHSVGQEVHCNNDVAIIYFKCFIKKIAQEIKDVSSTVFNFSTNCFNEISSVASSIDKNDVKEKAEQTHLCIDKVCTALTSILRRDKDFNYNLKAVLNKTEFGNFYVDEDQIDVYGVFIESCLKQAYDLKRIIEDILSAVED